MGLQAPPPTPVCIPPAPIDPILTLHQAFLADSHPHATNLCVGVLQNADNSLLEYPSVRSVQHSIPPAPNGYLPIAGYAPLRKLAVPLIYGDSASNVALIHTVSGSAALRLAIAFCKNVLKSGAALVSNPSWPNHAHIAQAEGLKVRQYTYYVDGRLDVNGMVADLDKAKEASVVILQPCAHNPTGLDPTKRQWIQIASVVKRRRLIPVFDLAYQGLASGDMDEDAFAIRLFCRVGIPLLVAQSFSKNMALYNSRVGTLSFAAEDVSNVEGQLSWLARAMYSTPPVQGARIVATVLSEWRAEWEREVGEVVERMDEMRRRFGNGEGKGMFTLLGLDTEGVRVLREVWHVFVGEGGRVNVGGLNLGNLQRVVRAVREVVKER